MQNRTAHVKRDDMVIVTAGKEKTKTGKILRVDYKKSGVIVEGLNIIKRHTRAKNNQPSGIIEKEALIHISNVMLYCEKCKKPVKTKVLVLEDGKKSRICKKCGEAFDK